ncbi:putative holin-like toxin [Aneurinibacillus sp. Ricciae_BoGa-3]|nr:putative holin-like toxin [Aneurinibacillus sp. Ricciae_BoGa-3]WCK53296.1 putative holin-like toxin [Aneurinibacillus sp. Ricciae_BoGa-3]
MTVTYEAMNLAVGFGTFVLTFVGVIVAIVALIKKK